MHIFYVLIKYYLNSKIIFLDWPLFISIVSASLYPRFLIFFQEMEEKFIIDLIKIMPQLILKVSNT